MGLVTRALILIAMVACLTSVSHATDGLATYYTPTYVPSSCYGFEDRGVMIVAANTDLFAGKTACGRKYRVRCTGATNLGVPHPCREGTVDLIVVDLCPGCAGDQLDLSQEAFATIADPNAGKIKIEYYQI